MVRHVCANGVGSCPLNANVSRQMTRARATIAWMLTALLLPLLLTYAYVAQDQWRHPGNAGWAAWAIYPFGVGVGVVAAFMVPLRGMWARALLAVSWGVLLAVALFYWGFFLACIHGDCT